MEGGETWETALEREAHEEAGVIIDKPILFGSVIVTQSQQPISGYPERTVLPFTWSQVLKIDEGWQPRETLGRRICSISEVRKLFGERNDNHQMEEIFEYLLVNKRRRIF